MFLWNWNIILFGDIGDTVPGKNNIKRSPFQGGFSYTLRLINPINEYLDVAFYAMFGNTSVKKKLESLFIFPEGLIFNSTVKSGGTPLITILTSY